MTLAVSMSRRMSLSLKPHHILCSIGFAGKGYNEAFTANMANIVNGQLRTGDGRDVRILITARADAICAPCPLRVGLDCQKQEKIERLDAAHAEILGLKPGELTTWGACLDRVRANVRPDDLDTICAGCEFLPLGICKAALSDLLDTAAPMKKAAPEGTAPICTV